MSGSYVNLQRFRCIQSVLGDGVFYSRAIVDAPLHGAFHYGTARVCSNWFANTPWEHKNGQFDLAKGLGCWEIITCIKWHVHKVRCRMYDVYRERRFPHLPDWFPRFWLTRYLYIYEWKRWSRIIRTDQNWLWKRNNEQN